MSFHFSRRGGIMDESVETSAAERQETSFMRTPTGLVTACGGDFSGETGPLVGNRGR